MAGKSNENLPTLQDTEILSTTYLSPLPKYNSEVKNLSEMTEKELAELKYEIDSKTNFFQIQLEKRGVSFFINGSGFVDDINIFQESIGIDILSVLEKHIELQPLQGFTIQKSGSKLGIFDTVSGTGLLIYDTESTEYFRFANQVVINTQNALSLTDIDFEFDAANHFE